MQAMDSNTETFTRAMLGLEAPPKPPVHPNGGWQADQSQLVRPCFKIHSLRLLELLACLAAIVVGNTCQMYKVTPFHCGVKPLEGCCLHDPQG